LTQGDSVPGLTALSVIASKAKQSRLGDCGGGFVWIASLSLAMTDPPSFSKPTPNISKFAAFFSKYFQRFLWRF
jgi:hypothetical protein